MTSSPADSAEQAHQLALQGATLFQAGQGAQAREACLQALSLAPHSAEVLLLLAFIALHANQPGESIDWSNRALAVNGNLADAYFLRGEAQQQAQLYEAAASSYDAALRLKPAHADAWNNRGNAYHALGQQERALASYDKAIELNPAKASFHNNRGLALKEQGNNPLAIGCFEQAIALQRDYGLAHFNLGLSLFALGRYEEAAASHTEAIRLMPGHALSHWGRADALRASGHFEASLEAYDAALALDPGRADIYNNRGLLLHVWGRHQDALADFAMAAQLDPGHADAHCNSGMALEALGRHAQALGEYEAAIARSPGHAAAHFNHALCHLTLGRYREGWREYEWRWQTGQLRSSQLQCEAPLWTGKKSLEGERILLHAEQGFGDSLQFCRYLPLVAELGATLIVQVPAPLAPLIRSISGVSQVVTAGEALPKFDFHCPFMSLPLAFDTTLETVPYAQRYLTPSLEKSLLWQQRLGARRLPRIGLVWAGAPHASLAVQRPVDIRRSIPLERFAPLSTSEAEFFSLQKGEPAASQLRELEEKNWDGPRLVDFTIELRDFEDTAALIDQIDLVISVDTSVAHLAGALGKPVWLLNRFDTCWRWMTERDDSPWYPTMRIFRQPAAGDWNGVIARVRTELPQFIAQFVAQRGTGS
ncbi:MAG: tetratricopeptide repeat protein [Pseudomonadota bacterium]|uniref:tetratricopeptide repeat protein n=1 Tax=Burkholderia sp. 4M9327F10 TaxID=2502223 RepID=UPI0010F632F8|nr:tetratricopeptide repeat protein [Burkholderia sp. 4M9327F10]